MEERGPHAQPATGGILFGLGAVTPNVGPVQVGPGSRECAVVTWHPLQFGHSGVF